MQWREKSKDRVTVLVCANMSGIKNAIACIGKFARPRCFNNA